MSILFSQEEVTERYGYERFLEGRNEGLSQASENIALSMLKEKMDAAVVAKCTKLPLSRVQELSKTI